jgi:hypothetical protein
MSAPLKGGGLAFPQAGLLNHGGEVVCASHYYAEAGGMTLRDYFAGQALVGLLSHPDTKVDPSIPRALVRLMKEGPFAMADAMLEAREAKQ